MAGVKQLSVQEARAEIEAGRRFVIDTRLPFDYFGGHIPESLNLPGKSIESRKGHVPEGEPLLIVGDDDRRGQEIAEFALSLGFSDVASLVGGMDAWSDADLPVETITDSIGPSASRRPG